MTSLRSKSYILYAHENQKVKGTEAVEDLKKIGRPLKAKTKLSHDLKVRLDDETYERLCLYCENTGMEKATVIRAGLQFYLDTNEKEKKQ